MGLSTISAWPTWLVLVFFSVLFLVIMFGARWLLARLDEERREEVADLAKSLNGPVGATLAFLVGFAVSITYGTMSTAQSAIERLASQAQQTTLLADSVLDRPASATLDADLVAYLKAIAEQDQPVLAQEEVTDMPSFTPLVKMQTDARDLVRSADGDDQELQASRTVQNNVITMAGIQAELNAVARRGLPPIVLQLLVLTGCLSAATVGMLAVGIRRPYLIAGWALVIAMGLSVVIALYNPFAGSVAVTFDPLRDAVQRILG